MAHIYMGVPPQSGTSSAVETGVFLRMGTYVDDTAPPVDEYSHMPKGYRDLKTDALDSEGIFITSVGTYIVIADEESFIEVEEDATLNVTDSNSDGNATLTTEVKSGNIEIVVEEGKFNLIGQSGYDIESTDGNVEVEAKSGKVKIHGSYFYTHTYGYYIKTVNGSKEATTIGSDTTVSLALVLNFYLSVSVSAKVAALTIKLFSTGLTLASINAIGGAMDFNGTTRAYLMHDVKIDYIYVKYRGIQVENGAVKTTFTAADKVGKLTWVGMGLTESETNVFNAAWTMRSYLPVFEPPVP